MNTSSSIGCSPTADDAFGPIVQQCRDNFDFTITFEQYFFTIVPASLLLLAAPFRLRHLSKRPRAVTGDALRFTKLASIAVLAVLQLVLVILWATQYPAGRLRTVSVAASGVSFASSLMFCILSYIEHSKSLKPSSILNAYLVLTVVLDAAILRSLWLANKSTSIEAIFTASFALKATALILEAREKTKYIISDGRTYNPEETSGIYSQGFFWWLTPLLMTGFRRLLKPLDLFVLDDGMSAAALNDQFWLHWNNAPDRGNYKLIKVLLATLKWPIIAVVFPRLCLLAFTICQPLILNRFLGFLQNSSESVNNGYGLIAAYGIVYFGIAISSSFYWHRVFRAITMLRGVLVTAIFTRTTELSITASDNSAAVTLMSTDVESIVRAMREINEFWANIIQIAIATWLLSTQIGFAASGPIIVSFVALLATVFVAPRAQKYQVSWVQHVQKRIGITSAMIGHIKSIKMSGLSQKLATAISDLRLAEMKAAAPFRALGAITSAVAQIPLMISPPVAFAMFTVIAARTGETLDATRLFAALSLIILLAQPLFWMFECVLDMGAALGCLKRIEKYLLESSRKEYRAMTSSTLVKQPSSETGVSQEGIELRSLRLSGAPPSKDIALDDSSTVEVAAAAFAWKSDSNPVLGDINFSVRRGQLAMLVGPVASGKTTLLKGLLGEVPEVTGRVAISGDRLSWCDQSPWLTNATVRENILGFAKFDEQLYQQVLKACDLEKDLHQLSDGDQTVIGSKGLALSGGQKQRVALARAIYSRPQIALFDDIFSGLDNHTAETVFQRLFSSKEGILRAWGTTTVLATQSVGLLSSADLIVSLGEGKIVEKGTYEELRNSGGYVESLATTQTDESDKTEKSTIEAAVSPSEQSAERKASKKTEIPEDSRRQLGDWSVYRYYFSSAGTTMVVMLLLLEVVWAFLSTFPTIWLKFWTDSNAETPNQHNAYYLGVYSAMQVVGILSFAVLIWFMLVIIAARSGIALHERLLSTVMRAPMSLFTGTDLGSITTRFSQDIGLIDRALPLGVVISIASFFACISRAFLIASVSWYLVISFPFLLGLLYYLQRAYLRTSRQLRLLDLEEKAPVYTQFLETLGGLSTIRAFAWGKKSIDRNFELVDRSQRPFYLLLMVQQWLTLVLDLITTALAILVIGLAVRLRDSVSVGLTGVSLIQLISLTESLKLLIQFWTSLETSIGAVGRIKQFGEETPDEALPGEDNSLPEKWPPSGEIEIRDVSASYGEHGEIKALDGISLYIRAGEKVGICGRTGSGKSSFLLSILRLLDLSSGSITVDGINLATINREELRSRLIAITQDQFVLPGTVRQNVDPFGVCTSDDIVATLTRLNLWDTINTQGGLDIQFDEEMLSHGQRQLFFLARAVLRKENGKIVLLDEATSSVDQHTEKIVQEVIRDEFSQHTVISIAHRLDTIVDFDQVVVLENGCVVETGQPRELLKTGGKFKNLWDASQRNGKEID